MLVQAVFLPMAVAAGFRIAGVRRTQRWLRRWARKRKTATAGFDAAAVILSARRAQRMAARNAGIGGTCLVRSLTLWAMLLRRGVDSELRVGVRKKEGKLEAHAWVEYGGVPLNESWDNVGTYSVYEKPLAFDW
jgi:hypothetical protein